MTGQPSEPLSREELEALVDPRRGPSNPEFDLGHTALHYLARVGELERENERLREAIEQTATYAETALSLREGIGAGDGAAAVLARRVSQRLRVALASSPAEGTEE